MFGPVLGKSWRLYKVFTQRVPDKRVVSTQDLRWEGRVADFPWRANTNKSQTSVGQQIKLVHDKDGCHNHRPGFTPGWAWALHLFLHNEAGGFPLYRQVGTLPGCLFPSGVPAPSLSNVLILHWTHAFITLHTSVCVQVQVGCFCGMKINQVSSKACDVGPSPDGSNLFLKAGRLCWVLLFST